MKNEVHKAMSSQTRYYIETIERDLSRVMQRQSELVVNNNLLNVAFLPNFLSPREIQYNIQRVTREIAILKDTSDFVKDVRIYVTDDQNSIFLSNSALFYLQKDIAEYFDIPDETTTSCIISNSEYHLIDFYPKNIPIKHAKYLIDIELSGAAIRDTLDHMYMGENGLVLITSKDSSWLVTNTALESEPVDFVPSLVSMSTSGTVKNGDSLLINNKYYVLYFENLDDFGLILFTLYPEQTMESRLNMYHMWFWFLLIMALLIVVVFGLYLNKQIHKPIRKLVTAFGSVQRGDLKIRLSYSGNDEFSYLYRSFNKTITQLQELIQENYENKIYAQMAELSHLQAQINPHFLYNCFFGIYNMAQLEDYGTIMQMTQYLANYYRFLGKDSGDFTTLEEDYQHTLNYLNIQLIRFGNRVLLRNEEIPQLWRNTIVPKLTIIPIVENIFKHVFDRSIYTGIISIKFEHSDTKLSIIIEDNGKGIDDEQIEKLRSILDSNNLELQPSGLVNVHKRIRLHFGEKSGLIISRSDLGGLKVAVNITKNA